MSRWRTLTRSPTTDAVVALLLWAQAQHPKCPGRGAANLLHWLTPRQPHLRPVVGTAGDILKRNTTNSARIATTKCVEPLTTQSTHKLERMERGVAHVPG